MKPAVAMLWALPAALVWLAALAEFIFRASRFAGTSWLPFAIAVVVGVLGLFLSWQAALRRSMPVLAVAQFLLLAAAVCAVAA